MNDTLLTQLKIAKLSGIKPNFSELARINNMDRRTIKKYYDGYPGKPKHRCKSSYLDRHAEIISAKLQINGATMRAVYEFILTEVDSSIGTYSNFRKYVTKNKLNRHSNLKGHPRFETAPGIQAQADWKEDMTIHNCLGEAFTFQVFSYKLGYSRYCHFSYRLFKTRQDVFDCLIASFAATGGVPREILFDNMTSVVDLKGHKRTVNSKFYAFAKDFGFKIKLCKPRHPFTKGKVEAANKFLDWLRPYEGEFETEDELREILDKITAKVNQYPCQETGLPPLLLLQKETEHLRPMPKDEVIRSYLSHNRQTTVRKDAMVSYKRHKYSVPCEYIGRPVTIRVSRDTLMVYYNTELIAQHTLSEKRLNYAYPHYVQLMQQFIPDEDAAVTAAKRNLKQMDAFI